MRGTKSTSILSLTFVAILGFTSSQVAAVPAPSPADTLTVLFEENGNGPRIAHRETVEEAALHARQLINYRSDGIGTFISVFGDDVQDSSLQGYPIGLQEYFAPSLTHPGDVYLLAFPISKIFHNVLVNPTLSGANLAVKDEVYEREHGNWNLVSRSRLSLFGSLKRLDVGSEEELEARKRYVEVHRDAGWILPPDGPHSSFLVRFQVEKIYWFGGFGNVSYLGWIPPELYRDADPTKGSYPDVLAGPAAGKAEGEGSFRIQV